MEKTISRAENIEKGFLCSPDFFRLSEDGAKINARGLIELMHNLKITRHSIESLSTLYFIEQTKARRGNQEALRKLEEEYYVLDDKLRSISSGLNRKVHEAMAKGQGAGLFELVVREISSEYALRKKEYGYDLKLISCSSEEERITLEKNYLLFLRDNSNILKSKKVDIQNKVESTKLKALMEGTKEIINLCPHPVDVEGPGGRIITIQPEQQAARATTRTTKVGEVNGVSIYNTTFGDIDCLPEEKEGRILIVSKLVQNMLPDRIDLFSPSTKIRDEETAQITGCIGIERITYNI